MVLLLTPIVLKVVGIPVNVLSCFHFQNKWWEDDVHFLVNFLQICRLVSPPLMILSNTSKRLIYTWKKMGHTKRKSFLGFGGFQTSQKNVQCPKCPQLSVTSNATMMPVSGSLWHDLSCHETLQFLQMSPWMSPSKLQDTQTPPHSPLFPILLKFKHLFHAFLFWGSRLSL